MSHLSRPRLHFRGKFYANVTTANNDDAVNIVDIETATIYPPDRLRDEEFKPWFIQPIEASSETNSSKKQLLRAGWNYYGDSSCCLRDVKVTNFQFFNETENLSNDDPLRGARVEFNKALMIDVDPESIFSSQIFWDKLLIKNENEDLLVFNSGTTPFYSCWHHSWRNLAFMRSFTGASAVWYAAIPNEHLDFKEQINTSEALVALKKAANEGKGLFIRFCTYFFQRTYTVEELQELFERVGHLPNPAYGQVVGTIGPWEQNEKAVSLVGMGRLLGDTNRLPRDGETFALGPALAKVIQNDHRKIVALDLISTFPERDESLEKEYLGSFSLHLQSPNDSQRPSKKIDDIVSYDKIEYELNGGIIEIPCPIDLEAKDWEEGKLFLFSNKAEFKVLEELELTIDLNQVGFYLQEGDKNKNLRLSLIRRGQPVQEPVQLKFEQYIMTNLHRQDKKAIFLPPPASPSDYLVKVTTKRMKDNIIYVEPGGICEVTLTAKKPGTCIIRFMDTQQPTASFMQKFTTSSFINIRVFPADKELANIPDKQLTFSLIYNKILRYFHLLYSPHAFFDPQFYHSIDREDRIKIAKEILKRINKNIGDVDYMPVTRDLSQAKCQLLDRWCKKIITEANGKRDLNSIWEEK